MDERSRPELIIRPPWIIDPDTGAFAVDVTHGAPPAGTSSETPLLCLGGHPSQECLLDVRGTGQTHDVAVSIRDLAPERARFLERLTALLRPSEPLQLMVSPRTADQQSRSCRSPFPAGDM